MSRIPDRWDADPDRPPGPPPGPTELPAEPDDDLATIARKRAAAAFRHTAWRLPAEPGLVVDADAAAKLGEVLADLAVEPEFAVDPDADDGDDQ